jgi:hypothetical protein
MSYHHGLPSRCRVIAAAACFVLVGFAPFAASVHGANLLIGFDNGPLITDGSGLDIDGVINDQIIFGGNYGTAGYWVSGTVRQSPAWPVGQSLSGYVPPITGGLTLTNFVAEAVAGSLIGTPLTVRYKGDYLGAYAAGTAVDTLDAEVGNSASSPVPAGTDVITYYQSAVFDNFSSVTILPATGGVIPLGNPFHPGPGTTPYAVTGHGPVAVPAMTNPTILSSFQIILGAANNQFILPSSAEVGFTSELVPEPGSTTLALLGGAGLAVAAARSRRRSIASAGRIRRTGSVTVDVGGPTS